MADPRLSIIDERLENVRRIIVVLSGKGGVGKSLIATMSALILARKGFDVGLFDLDFTGPSSHIILGVETPHFEEEKGIVPQSVHGIKFMSVIHYVYNHPLPLRGVEISDALLDMLTVTRWNSLNYLFIDMPPGLSDPVLDILRFIKKAEFLVVTTSSLLAFETVKKLLKLLTELRTPILGVIENMKVKDNSIIREKVEEMGLKFLGEIHFDPELEEKIGDLNKLFETSFSLELSAIIERRILGK